MQLKKIVGWILAVIGFLTLSLILVIAVLSCIYNKSAEQVPSKAILTLNLNNNITESPARDNLQQLLTGKTQTLYEITHALEYAAKDPKVKGLSVRADMISMGVGMLQELRDAVLKFRRSGKFATLHVDSFGELTPATFTYYLASAFDQIWMQPSGYLSISGLHTEMPFAAQVLEDFGVKPRIGTREEYKTAYTFLTDKELSSASAEQTKNLLKVIFSEILAGIANEREISEEAILKIMEESPILTAAKAQSLGLIDGSAYLDVYEQTVRDRAGADAQFFSISTYNEYVKKSEKSYMEGKEVVALIYGAGVIQRAPRSDGLLDEQLLTGEDTRRAFEAALKNPKVKAIVFRLNTPGGSAVASDSVLRWVHKAREQKIPVIASMGNVAASGGYWIASGCNKIVAQPLTLTGSIGVLSGKLVFGGLLEKLKINLGLISEGPNGSFWSFTQDYTEQQWNILQQSLDDTYNQFLHRVVQGRQLAPEHVKQIAKGRVWTGKEAKQYGLVDELGGIDKAIELAKIEAKIPVDQEVSIVVYPKAKSLYEKLKDIVDSEQEGSTTVFGALYQTLSRILLLLRTEVLQETLLARVPQKIE